MAFGDRVPAQDFNTLNAATNNSPRGLWSDGTTMWVSDHGDDKLYAYNMVTKVRDASKDFNTLNAATNNAASGLWSDGVTMWVSDVDNDKIYAYNLSTKARDDTQDFDTLNAATNNNPAGLWSDGTTMWVADTFDGKLYAYNMTTKARDASKDFDALDADNIHPRGIWSNGTTMWVSDATVHKLYAYNMTTKARIPTQDFNLIGTDNRNPWGIWSDGSTMWVSDWLDDKIYAYNSALVIPVIDTFTSSDTTPDAGEDVVLTWTTTDATSVTLNGVSVAVDGSQTIDGMSSTSVTYTLIATSSDGIEASESLTVTWPASPLPTIDTFTVSDTTPAHNEDVTLTWTTTDAATVTLNGEAVALDGTQTITAMASTSVVYTLIATHAQTGTTTATLTVTWPATPSAVIDTFTVSDIRPDADEDVVITWTTTNAIRVVLSRWVLGHSNTTVNVDVDVDGSSTVDGFANESYTFRLSGYNINNQLVQSAQIDVRWAAYPPPVIDSYTATATDVDTGDNVTLTWATTDAITVTLNGESVFLDGFTVVGNSTPTTTDYVLVALNLAGVEVEQTITVTWGHPDVVVDFTASTQAPAHDEDVTLTWTTEEATTVTLNGEAVALDGTQTITAMPGEAVTYTIVATGLSGTVNRNITVVWPVTPPPTIDTYTASATTLAYTEELILTWDTTTATNVTLNGDAVSADGTETILPLPGQTVTYTLVATSPVDTVEQSITVTWAATPTPTIDSFTASAMEVESGDPITLTWATTNALSATLNGSPVTVDGSQVETQQMGGVHDYVLIATHASGGTTSQTLTLTWTSSLPLVVSFEADYDGPVHVGTEVTVSWEVQDADTVTVNGNTRTATGSLTVTRNSPTTRTYTLVATNGDGDTTVVLTVRWANLTVNIQSFTADVSPQHVGADIVLTWATNNATETVTLNGSPQAVDGSADVVQTSVGSITYTLVATNDFTTDTATLTVTWGDFSPVITLTTSDATPDIGDIVTISWNVTGADSVLVRTLTDFELAPPDPPGTLPPYQSIAEGFRSTLASFRAQYEAWKMATAPYGITYTAIQQTTQDELDALTTALEDAITDFEELA